MSEFTGERVIPGQVNADLWAEHIARYAFAAQIATGKLVLDVGCGTGYGTAELARTAAAATGADVSREAIGYARDHYWGPTFIEAPAGALPFDAASFHLVTAFEVIEHLADWNALLLEARRVLCPDGILLVSTPNTLYYAESRAESGPNPYHEHEFEFAEFKAALEAVFPHVRMYVQNRLEAFAFYDAECAAVNTGEARFESVAGPVQEAHFFIGICSGAPLSEMPPFVHVPRASNLLREREQHIRLLQTELKQNQKWLADTTANRDQLLAEHGALEKHLEQQNQWGQELETLWRAAQQRILDLQEELERVTKGYEKQIAHLVDEDRKKTAWAVDTEARLMADLEARAALLAHTVELLDKAEATVVERTEWAQKLDAELGLLQAKLGMIRESRWVKLGRTFGVGPEIGRE